MYTIAKITGHKAHVLTNQTSITLCGRPMYGADVTYSEGGLRLTANAVYELGGQPERRVGPVQSLRPHAARRVTASTADQVTELLDDTVQQLRGFWSPALVEAVEVETPLIVERILSRLGDPETMTEQAVDLATLVGPPDGISAEWWATPLGRIVGRTYGPGYAITQADAARVLGVTRARVNALVREGKLTTVDGGVTLASVLARMV